MRVKKNLFWSKKMRERLYFEVEGKEKKLYLEALKNEQRFNKKIPIYNVNGEKVAEILKWDDYYSYIDFWLEDLVEEELVNESGKISSIEIEYFEKKEGIKLPRIKRIVS